MERSSLKILTSNSRYVQLNNLTTLILFTSFNKVAHCIYADIESILEADGTKFGKSSEYINEHKPVAIGYAIKSSWTDIITEKYIYGLDCIQKFVENIESFCKVMINLYHEVIDSAKYVVAKNKFCSFCDKELVGKGYKSSHAIFGEGVTVIAHCICFINTSKYLCKQTKVFFHNLKGYDSHFLIDELGRKARTLDIILKSKEKGIAISVWFGKEKFVFLDSLSFLSGSLASCSEKLSNFNWIGSNEIKSNMPLEYLKQYQGKQSFPYEYVSGIDILENKPLPSDPLDWYSTLKGCSPSNEIIKESLDTFDKLKMTNIKEYMMFYLRIDVLLLLEVFESFRDMVNHLI